MPLDAWPVAVFVVGGDRVVQINANGLRLIGADGPASIVGRPTSEILVLGDPVSVDLDGGVAPDGAGTQWRHALIRPLNGGSLPVLVSRGEEWARGRERLRMLVVVPAASERNGGLLDVEARAEARGQIADVFANLAHEMRTPLNAVIGFGEILLGEHFGPLAGRYRDYARDIVGAGYHLLALVNGALDLGRASAGAASLDERPVELRSVLSSAIAMLEQAASAKSIALTVDDLAGLPLVYADETRMRQLFVNLIGNAIKYSPSSRPVVVRHRLDDDGEIRIDVVDQGTGMTREEVAIALLPFGRTESAIRTGEAGTGLGLPISKAIVEAHGGRMTIDSAPRRGTTVTVVLPANRLVAAPGRGGLLNLL
ncbi:sensor histidine kinase [Thalassobaculum fulvum]|uniref:sensor histidine kinase n=1 Tax=Thalassobaculum fulvum TaxID=1633335 RepID=UPI0016729DDF|nr:HAMP domain-containing sensor histidine kinase [Thalassobaculum fulvum]